MRLRPLWSGLSRLSRVMLVLSVLASAVVAVLLALVLYLFIGGYSGGSSPTNIAPVLIPVALLLLIVAGPPAVLLCGLLWAGYRRSRRRHGPADHKTAAGPRD